ncbi:MAG: sodium:proline symporter, partial [Bacteroidota bacterium]|nr:sodium:proline symporter [Bacteroidota bacterium]
RYSGDPAFIKDPESGYIRILLSDLPFYFRGLMLAAFAAAYMSTIGTQLNWGASYVVNDVYKRYLPNKKQKHYVLISQLVTLVLMFLSAFVTFYMDSIAGAWKFLMAIGAGTGLVYILRWFWWRINAWSEISAMAAAFIVSIVLQFGFNFKEDDPTQFAHLLLITVSITTFVWLLVTFLTKPEPEQTLKAFFKRVRPNPTFWKPIAKLMPEVKAEKDGIFSMFNWLLGVFMIYGMLFGMGYILLKNVYIGIALFILGLALGALLYYRLNKKGWESLGS